MSYALLYFLLLPPFVHVSYVYVMGLKRARDEDRLTWPVKMFAYPTIVVMLPFYVALNLTVGTLLFLELPRSLQFTARCQRHLDADTWRGAQARWWCRHFLDPYDPAGKHC